MKQHDFNYAILDETAHRPWPMPASPWIMTQTWHNLLFAHWAVEPAVIRRLVPPVFELDLYDGQAWIAIVPFHMTNVAPRAVPALPWISQFPELNVRTYVRCADRGGVYFFSLDAANPVAVGVARTLVHLPYFNAEMRVDVDDDGWIAYRSCRKSTTAPAAELEVRYRPAGPVTPPVAGTLEYFLTERYCLFTIDRASRPYSLDIHHPPWPLRAAEASFHVNTMAQASGIQLPSSAPLLHFSGRQDMVAWGLKRIDVGP